MFCFIVPNLQCCCFWRFEKRPFGIPGPKLNIHHHMESPSLLPPIPAGRNVFPLEQTEMAPALISNHAIPDPLSSSPHLHSNRNSLFNLSSYTSCLHASPIVPIPTVTSSVPGKCQTERTANLPLSLQTMKSIAKCGGGDQDGDSNCSLDVENNSNNDTTWSQT